LAAPPLARACDMEAINAEMTTICLGALNPTRAAAEAVMAGLPEAEKTALAAALARAGDACETGDPAQGTREAAVIMRLIGHIEARLGLAPPNLSPQRLGGVAPAPRG
ncbi:MAG: hypothetical protein EBT34_07025, partial [Acetobacteraceae bacterium]|nr:hypothetical protein [Acetobacteraceae bacterium]